MRIKPLDFTEPKATLMGRLLCYALNETLYVHGKSDEANEYAKLMDIYHDDLEFKAEFEDYCIGFGCPPLRYTSNSQLILHHLTDHRGSHPLLTARHNTEGGHMHGLLFFGIAIFFYRDRGSLAPLFQGTFEFNGAAVPKSEIFIFVKEYVEQQSRLYRTRNPDAKHKTVAMRFAEMNVNNDAGTSKNGLKGRFEATLEYMRDYQMLRSGTVTETGEKETGYAPTIRLMAVLAQQTGDKDFQKLLRDAQTTLDNPLPPSAEELEEEFEEELEEDLVDNADALDDVEKS